VTGHTYTRRIEGQGEVQVHRAPIAHHEAEVRKLNAIGLTDGVIAGMLGLHDPGQVRGIRRRANPQIPAAAPRGRPRGR